MSVISTAPARTGDAHEPAVLLLYGEEYANLALADELAFDGYEVRRASDPRDAVRPCDTGEVELVILGRATRRGAGLDEHGYDSAVLESLLARGSDGEGPLSEQDLWDAFGAKKNKQKFRITDALDRSTAPGSSNVAAAGLSPRRSPKTSTA